MCFLIAREQRLGSLQEKLQLMPIHAPCSSGSRTPSLAHALHSGYVLGGVLAATAPSRTRAALLKCSRSRGERRQKAGSDVGATGRALSWTGGKPPTSGIPAPPPNPNKIGGWGVGGGEGSGWGCGLGMRGLGVQEVALGWEWGLEGRRGIRAGAGSEQC